MSPFFTRLRSHVLPFASRLSTPNQDPASRPSPTPIDAPSTRSNGDTANRSMCNTNKTDPSSSPASDAPDHTDVTPPLPSAVLEGNTANTASSTPDAAPVDESPLTSQQVADLYYHGLPANDRRLAGLDDGPRRFNIRQDCCTFLSPFPGRMQIAVQSKPENLGRRVGCGGTLRVFGSKKGNGSNKLGEHPELLVPFSLIANIILFKTLRNNSLFSFEMIVVPVGAVGTSSVSERRPRCIHFFRSNEGLRRNHHPEWLKPYTDELIAACNDQLHLFGKKVTYASLAKSIAAEWDIRELGYTSEAFSHDESVVAFFVKDAILIKRNDARHLYIPFGDDGLNASSIILVANCDKDGEPIGFEIRIDGVTEAPFWTEDSQQAPQTTITPETTTEPHQVEDMPSPHQAAPPIKNVRLKVKPFDKVKFDKVWETMQEWEKALPQPRASAASVAQPSGKENVAPMLPESSLPGEKRKREAEDAEGVELQPGSKVRRMQVRLDEGKPLSKLEEYVE
ncbi:hypothetical protein LTR97_009652 [Elasticomyces elasticus]|uniref:Uncharacterized protein n=1 Tax=Elasticomyces elasticus TaxID=574655 RepID=A0AAN7ZLU6_9PEZI|nr:hypothetical protein LTR97_009652 [Elasticomyces elasticus]